MASGLKLPYLGADRDLLEELVASRRLYSLKLFNGFTGCGVLEYLYLAEVTCIGKALIVGILLCLDIRLQNGAGTFMHSATVESYLIIYELRRKVLPEL